MREAGDTRPRPAARSGTGSSAWGPVAVVAPRGGGLGCGRAETGDGLVAMRAGEGWNDLKTWPRPLQEDDGRVGKHIKRRAREQPARNNGMRPFLSPSTQTVRKGRHGETLPPSLFFSTTDSFSLARGCGHVGGVVVVVVTTGRTMVGVVTRGAAFSPPASSAADLAAGGISWVRQKHRRSAQQCRNSERAMRSLERVLREVSKHEVFPTLVLLCWVLRFASRGCAHRDVCERQPPKVRS